MPSSFNLNLQPMIAATERRRATLLDRVRDALTPFEDVVGDWMQTAAPWVDRSGDARRGLHARVIVDDAANVITFLFSHNLDLEYPWWLETKFAGRDGIIKDAMDRWGPELMQAARAAL